ncbi:MAG: MBL fold metallo-hydrolase RNA specificity domain-containing protein, partial [Fimbriimonadaceae bacterium]
LLMEGTLLGRESVGEQSEASLQTVLQDDLAKCGGLALLMFSPQNVDRLRTMLAAARATDRLLVADAYTLFVLHCIWRQARLPNPFDPANGIRVWFPDGYQDFGKSKSLRNVAHRLPAISLTKDQILADPRRHALVFRGWMAGKFPELVAASRLAVFSYWSGYQDTENTSLLRKQLESKGVRWLHRHASGHIRHDDLLAFIRKVQPKTLIPMHTETGDQFVKYLQEQHIRRLNDGEVFAF